MKQLIQDGDRVFLIPTKQYAPQTPDHQRSWPKMVAAIEHSNERGALYSTLKVLGGCNKDFAAYLIGQVHVLRVAVPCTGERLGNA